MIVEFLTVAGEFIFDKAACVLNIHLEDNYIINICF